MAIYNAEAEAIVIILIQPYQEKSSYVSFFALCLDFYKLDNVSTLTRVGESRKIPALGHGSSLGLRPPELPQHHDGISLHSPRALLSSRYSLSASQNSHI